MSVVRGQPKKNTQVSVIKQQNTLNALIYSLIITSLRIMFIKIMSNNETHLLLSKMLEHLMSL